MTNAEARFNKSHIRKVYACLAVTCHLHFWQNDRDFLRATVVTRGWNGYRNKSQHRKSRTERKGNIAFNPGWHTEDSRCTQLSPMLRTAVGKKRGGEAAQRRMPTATTVLPSKGW